MREHYLDWRHWTVVVNPGLRQHGRVLRVPESGIDEERGGGGGPLVGDCLDRLEPPTEGAAEGVVVVRLEQGAGLHALSGRLLVQLQPQLLVLLHLLRRVVVLRDPSLLSRHQLALPPSPALLAGPENILTHQKIF